MSLFSIYIFGFSVWRLLFFIGIFNPLIWIPFVFILMYKKLYSNDTKLSVARCLNDSHTFKLFDFRYVLIIFKFGSRPHANDAGTIGRPVVVMGHPASSGRHCFLRCRNHTGRHKAIE